MTQQEILEKLVDLIGNIYLNKSLEANKSELNNLFKQLDQSHQSYLLQGLNTANEQVRHKLNWKDYINLASIVIATGVTLPLSLYLYVLPETQATRYGLTIAGPSLTFFAVKKYIRLKHSFIKKHDSELFKDINVIIDFLQNDTKKSSVITQPKITKIYVKP